MNEQKQTTGKSQQSNIDLWIRGPLRLISFGVFVWTPLFWSAGTLDWFRGWVMFVLLGVTFTANLLVMLIKTPTLLRARWQWKAETKGYDKIIGVAYMTATIVMFTVAGLDAVRYQWSAMNGALLFPGVVLHILGISIVMWSVLVNPHLETTVRIQTDRGHRVISDGPYRLVRHPMYVGVIIMYAGWPFILQSWVSFGGAGLVGLILTVRAGLEDRTLKNELAGYAEFCQQTRYRMIPGVW